MVNGKFVAEDFQGVFERADKRFGGVIMSQPILDRLELKAENENLKHKT